MKYIKYNDINACKIKNGKTNIDLFSKKKNVKKTKVNVQPTYIFFKNENIFTIQIDLIFIYIL